MKSFLHRESFRSTLGLTVAGCVLAGCGELSAPAVHVRRRAGSAGAVAEGRGGTGPVQLGAGGSPEAAGGSQVKGLRLVRQLAGQALETAYPAWRARWLP